MIICKMAVRFQLKICKCDIQISKSNLQLYRLKGAKNRLFLIPFYLHQKECTAFHTATTSETLMPLNMACQVNKKKNLSAILRKTKRNYEEVFHEILPPQGTTASGQLLEVQNSVLPLTTLPPPPLKPPLTTIPVKLN